MYTRSFKAIHRADGLGFSRFYFSIYQIYNKLSTYLIKGSVQQKLRWAESGVDRRVLVSDCTAARKFASLIYCFLLFSIFPFPISTA